jgi:hypothetical protein
LNRSLSSLLCCRSSLWFSALCRMEAPTCAWMRCFLRLLTIVGVSLSVLVLPLALHGEQVRAAVLIARARVACRSVARLTASVQFVAPLRTLSLCWFECVREQRRAHHALVRCCWRECCACA